MAYMNQTKKAAIKEVLDSFMPKSWKWSLSVDNSSTIVFTVRSAPVDLLRICNDGAEYEARYYDLNIYYLERYFGNHPHLLDFFVQIKDALNTGNWDNSDPQSDYFDRGHYVDILIGRYDKPFVYTPEHSQKAA